MKNMTEVFDRANVEYDMMRANQIKWMQFCTGYCPSFYASGKHKGFVLAFEQPANDSYSLVYTLSPAKTKEQNVSAFMKIAGNLAILD